ncbi:MAG TPA: endonuclease MutS2 [Candidatus Blautia stercoripullorum]|uniref:Endonuclease MutS2 n=1 Tax=Candidatus Blautia stercoripullorum TaxID=2838502 RepID=A0A9D2U3R4_9FIRM|nr:endonuclease MutS2 [Candidatus Blautia stercoripullorum]
MNEKALKTLEYYKIIEMLENLATSSIGKDMCRRLAPCDDLGKIQLMQQETADALSRIYQKGALSFGGVKDIRGSLKRLEIGGTLGTGELLDIAGLLENAGRAKAYSRRDTEEENLDSLDGMFQILEPLTPLSSEIRRCILSPEEIADDASPGLHQVRRGMKNINEKIHSQLASYISGNARTYLQDGVITMRNGRYCIPVKSEYRSQVPGMIHDQSSTGSTVFVEPMAVVKLNNDLRELEAKEQAEIEIVLSNLSQTAGENLDLLQDDLKILAQLDFIFARALLAKAQNATEPRFNTEGIINLKKARHPLIEKHQVVPIDIRLGESFDLLVVTGPNTGGKTVSLKTVGLLTLMGQSGLHIPAFDNSQLSVFQEVYADIGDEQSIEQSLSTFSSHMTNVVHFLEKADKNSLVLFDELGAGTDPTEGAALAIAILSHLHSQGIRTMATTHYSELKVYALSTQGVENASCEFDVETLRPTYRLLIGVPGKSNAFAISSKLGLPDYIIDKAKEQISQEDESFEDVLTSLEASRKTIETEQEEIEKYKEEIKELKTQLEAKQDKLDQQKEKILRNANEEAYRILRDAKEYADQTMKIFNKAGKETLSAKELEAQREKLRKKADHAGKKIALKTPEKKKSSLTAKDISLGDSVRVLSLNVKGTISSKPDAKGMVYVQMGILRSKVALSDLELIDEPVITGPSLQKTGAGKIRMNKSASVRTEINLLGKTVDEAVAELDKYLDDAYLAHLGSVRIVHGKGTGALRKGIHNYLKRLKYVDNFHLAEFGEGDAGVTIVEFKK